MPAPAKVLPPRLTNVVARPRMVRLLDQSAARKIVWISSPAGSGKTTCIADYLKRRGRQTLWFRCDAGDGDPATFFYYLGLAIRQAAPRHKEPLPLFTEAYAPGAPTFALRFMESLCARLAPRAWLVFDDYQEISEGSATHALLDRMLDAVPAGMCVAVLSRRDPPPAFAHQQGRGDLALLDWSQMRFTSDEARRMTRLHLGRKAVQADRKAVADVERLADGWAAGVVLLTGQARRWGRESLAARPSGPSPVFDYFAQELFRGLDSPDRLFLLRTAIVPAFTADVAGALAGDPHADRTLTRLLRHTLLTTRFAGSARIYQYHPLMREFLLARGREMLSPEDLRELRRSGAGLMMQSGMVEDAMALLRDAEDWAGIGALAVQHAPAFIAQGRHRTVADWLDPMPEAQYERDPWSDYWAGMAQLQLDPARGRAHLERAFSRFEQTGVVEGTFLAWANLLNSYTVVSIPQAKSQDWLQVLDGLTARHGAVPGASTAAQVWMAAVFSLTAIDPADPRVPKYYRQAEAVLAAGPLGPPHLLLGLRLIGHYSLAGAYGRIPAVWNRISAAISESAALSPIDRVERQFWLGSLHFLNVFDSNLQVALQEAKLHFQDAIQIAKLHGIAKFVPASTNALVQIESLLGFPSRAQEYLAQLRALDSTAGPTLVNAWAHHAGSVCAYRQGDFRAAAEEAEAAIPLLDKFGSLLWEALGHAAAAFAYVELGERAAVARHLLRLHRIARTGAMPKARFMTKWIQARAARLRGRETAVLRHLQAVAAIGEPERLTYITSLRPEWMADLCGVALEHGTAPAYFAKLIHQYDLKPPQGSQDPGKWPWPLRVYTFGTLRLVRDGEPVVFGRKVQRRPLDLLKLLVAAREAGATESRLCDALWPDADGDAARDSLKVALRRLRGLVGDKAVIQTDRRYRLNPETCWVDAWALLQSNGPAGRTGGVPPNDMPGQALLRLYRGPFLPEDDALDGVARLRMDARVALAAVIQAARPGLEDRSAVEWLERGLSVDPGAQVLCESLMRRLLHQGEAARAVQAYERSKFAQQADPAAGPRPILEGLYRAALAGTRRTG